MSGPGAGDGARFDPPIDVAVVTGAASGIGRGLASRLVAEGVRVVAVDIDADAVAELAQVVDVVPFRLDVTDEAATSAMVAEVEATLGPVDLLCLNAGIATGGGVEASNEAWQRTWEVNLMSHVYGARAVLPSMLARGRGRLLHTASAAGLLTNIGAAPYSVTKHAVVALADWLSMTYGDRGIMVSCLCPQFVDTPMLDLFADGEGMREWVRGVAISADDVAESVVEGLGDGRFLILPHPEVARYVERRATDHDRWLASMRRLQSDVGYRPPELG